MLGLSPTPGAPNPVLGGVPADGGPAAEPRHQLPDSRSTLRLHPRGTPPQPLRVLGSKTPPFPRPVAHAGPELHLPAAQGPLPLCLISTLRFSSHSRQDQRDCALSPEVTVGQSSGPRHSVDVSQKLHRPHGGRGVGGKIYSQS